MKVTTTLLVLLTACGAARGVTVSPEEMAQRDRWVSARFDGAAFPFSFTYDGKPSAELLKTWPAERETRKLDNGRTERTLTFTDPKTGLSVRCVAVTYADFPTVEWTLYFKNTGKADTPILENIQALDATFSRGDQGEFTLYHQTGSPCTPGDYQPFATPLGPEASKRLAGVRGRPCSLDLPYLNLAWPGGGAIVVVGWPGQWAAELVRDKAKGLHIRAGQELTHFKLLPGEEVRSPLMAIQFHDGNRIRAQNVWRRWMLAHNLPRPGGKLPPPHLAACSSHFFAEMGNADTASQKLFIDRYLEEGIKLDYWWMDAGWYICDGAWHKTGTWEVDEKRFPGGLRPICDHAHAKGVKTIVWFEPERIAPGTWLAEKHPEWILGGALLNLGNPDALRWLTDHVDKLITEQGIDLYRQDFNIEPLACWRRADAPDRQGITENHHVTGYLAYWDELRRRHPNLLIDTCASGGNRNDLETLRRAVPLWRTDYIMQPVPTQGHTYGISFWMPFHGTGMGSGENTPYTLRSALVPAFNCLLDARRKDLDYKMIRRVIDDWRAYAPYYFGDYYPLTEYNLDPTQWIAWQFDCPERAEGMIQAFRRDQSAYESARFRLAGLVPDARYILTDVDGVQKFEPMTGRQLMEQGVAITIKTQPDAVVITYKKEK